MALAIVGNCNSSAVLIRQSYKILKSACLRLNVISSRESIPSFLKSLKMLSVPLHNPALLKQVPAAFSTGRVDSSPPPPPHVSFQFHRHCSSVAYNGTDAIVSSSTRNLRKVQSVFKTSGFTWHVRHPTNISTQVRYVHATPPADWAGAGFGDGGGEDDSEPIGEGPPVVRWEKSKVNTIRLAGVISEPDKKVLPSGVCVTKFGVGVKQPQEMGEGEEITEVTNWFTVECWADLGEAVSGLPKGTRVALQGRLRQEEYTNREGIKKSVIKIRASSVSLMDSSPHASQDGDRRQQKTYASPSPPPPPSPSRQMAQPATKVQPPVDTEALWKELLESPHLWTDNRGSKINPEKSPDFRRKRPKQNPNAQLPEALWIDTKNTPPWVPAALKKWDGQGGNTQEGGGGSRYPTLGRKSTPY